MAKDKKRAAEMEEAAKRRDWKVLVHFEFLPASKQYQMFVGDMPVGPEVFYTQKVARHELAIEVAAAVETWLDCRARIERGERPEKMPALQKAEAPPPPLDPDVYEPRPDPEGARAAAQIIADLRNRRDTGT